MMAVMAVVGSKRALLVGYSEGGPMATVFAASHPERVSGLVLYGSYAKRVRGLDYPWAQSVEDRASFTRGLVAVSVSGAGDSFGWRFRMRARADVVTGVFDSASSCAVAASLSPGETLNAQPAIPASPAVDSRITVALCRVH